MIGLPPRIRKVLAELQSKLESVTESDSGILVVPKLGLRDQEVLYLHVKLIETHRCAWTLRDNKRCSCRLPLGKVKNIFPHVSG